ncbi:MAG: GNAT family N-acetyltransferase [Marinilabiliaceae bacterium]
MDPSTIQIHETLQADLEDILFVEKAAFKTDEEAQLTAELLEDPSARPFISLLASKNNKPIGHVLFTKARIEGYQSSENVSLLAPLAVVPDHQGQGIGGMLIKEGLHRLKENGVEMVFVLGDPDYYRKHGFVPDAGSFGFDPPFDIPQRNAEAWMVQPLTIQGLSKSVGKFVPANSINKQKYWKE